MEYAVAEYGVIEVWGNFGEEVKVHPNRVGEGKVYVAFKADGDS